MTGGEHVYNNKLEVVPRAYTYIGRDGMYTLCPGFSDLLSEFKPVDHSPFRP